MQDKVVAGAPRFRILGQVELFDDGGPVALRSRHQRLMLVILLLEANRAVPADRLIEELWGDQLPDDPAGSLRTQVSRLRRSLPMGTHLVTEPRGYRLTVDPDDVDLCRFERLLTSAGHVADDDGLRLLDEALALWHDHPLDEFVDRPFAQIEQRRLDELRDAARERRLSLLLAAGRAPEAVAEAEALLVDQPEREHARAVLMEALYRLGRFTEALETFQSWRRALGERGLEPSPALQDVELRILRHTVDSDPQPLPNAPVPRAVSSFIGRDTDLLGVADLVDIARLVTLWGPGGVGKTRLALEVAAAVSGRYRDGVHVCDLTVLSAGGDVARAIASSVGVNERSGRRLEAQLVDRLDGRRLLLILDNCEHVLQAAASIAQLLVRSTSGVDVLATSRERLGIDGEHLWEVVPLDADHSNSPAIELFVDRARATSPSFRPSAEDREVIADLCRRLDGLPLALELGAARIRGFSLRELLATLDVRSDVLQGGAGRPHRHRSLRAVLDWSYSLLTPVDQRVFDRLAVFRGAFSLDAARAVVSDDDLDADTVEVAVLALLDRALLAERAEQPTRRYSMLDTVRRYGIEHLERDACLERAARRHAHWILEETERAAAGLAGPEEAAWAATIEDSLDELRAAHRWLVGHDLEGALRLTAALRRYALWRGHSEIFRWAEVAAAAAAGTGLPLLPQALLAASTGAWQRGDLAGARAAADAIPGAGVPAQTRRAALEASADIALLVGELHRAEAQFTEAYGLAMAAGDVLQAIWDIGSAAVTAGYIGDTERALQLAAAASSAAEGCGSPSAQAFAHFVIGEILAPDQPQAAEAHLWTSIDFSAIADSRFVTGLAEVALAASRSRQQDIAAALTHCRSAIDRWHRVGAWTPLWVAIRTVITLLVRAAAVEDAAVLLGGAQSARTGAPSFGVDAATMLDAAEQLRQALGDETFERLLGSGQSMSEDEALQFAVAALERASSMLCPPAEVHWP